ncbi:MAG: sulfatase [Thermoanaerobaculia bacterium]
MSAPRASAAKAAAGLLLLSLACFACDGGGRRPNLILVSVDTLRADHLGTYGYERETSPFLDALADSGVVFERAFAQVPGTLPSHMSMFTGLYPAQHDVYPPNDVLSTDIETLPEILESHGYRTGGFTEGGYVSGFYGFARGFDSFDDTVTRGNRLLERTIGEGLDFLDRVGDDEPFFLFLHTYAVHDPYQPPEEYRPLFWEGAVPDTFEPTGPNFVAVNRGRRTVTAEEVRYFESLYDAGIRYVDDQLQRLWQRLQRDGLSERTLLVVTSDHGEEFLEHGHLVHEQNYVETTHVPLIVVGPGLPAGTRVGTLVQSIDLAPSLLDLAGLADTAEEMTGRSWKRLLTAPDGALRDFAYSESFVHPVRGIVRLDRERGELLSLLESRIPAEPDGQWIGRTARLDTLAETLELEAVSFRIPRPLRVEDGEAALSTTGLQPDVWTPVTLELGPGAPPAPPVGARPARSRRSSASEPDRRAVFV